MMNLRVFGGTTSKKDASQELASKPTEQFKKGIVDKIGVLAANYQIESLSLIKLKSNDNQNRVCFHYTANETLSLIDKAKFKMELAKLLNFSLDQIQVDDSAFFTENFYNEHFELKQTIYARNAINLDNEKMEIEKQQIYLSPKM